MMPNFFIVGAAKSGTTSLWRYLRQHPQIFLPENKEPNYFAYEGRGNLLFPGPADPEEIHRKLHGLTVTEFENYKALFHDVASEKAVGESSVRYLYFPQACENIYRSLPDSKIIIILRSPVDRLYSHFLMMKGLYSLEPLALTEALEQEQDRLSADWDWDWHYVRVSMYFEQVRRYLDLFGPNNVRIFIYEDFCENALSVTQEIFRFLEVEEDFVPDISGRSMQTYWPRSSGFDWLLRNRNWINRPIKKVLPQHAYRRLIKYGMRLNNGTVPTLEAPTRLRLEAIFEKDVLNLENLLGRKLPWIKKCINL